jgi:hypothetical protein
MRVHTWSRPLDYLRDASDRESEGELLIHLSRACRMLGDPENALINCERALAIWREVGNGKAEAGAILERDLTLETLRTSGHAAFD